LNRFNLRLTSCQIEQKDTQKSANGLATSNRLLEKVSATQHEDEEGTNLNARHIRPPRPVDRQCRYPDSDWCLAVGAMAIGRLRVLEARIEKFCIGTLTVDHLDVRSK